LRAGWGYRDARVSSPRTAEAPAKPTPTPNGGPGAPSPGQRRSWARIAGTGSLTLVVLTQVTNVLNYGSNLAFSRILEP
jgi:hypothetical protein